MASKSICAARLPPSASYSGYFMSFLIKKTKKQVCLPLSLSFPASLNLVLQIITINIKIG